MSDQCELFEVCRFMLSFEKDPEVIREGWIHIFCENKEKSEECQRKKILKETGKPPVYNMTPTGKLLS
jgi:hypothetical protein